MTTIILSEAYRDPSSNGRTTAHPDVAADRQEWEERAFLERQRTVAYIAIAAAAALVLIGLGTGTLLAGASMIVAKHTRVIVGTALCSAGFLGAIAAAAVPFILRARRGFRAMERAARARARAAAGEVSEAASLSDLLRANRKQMQAYDELARLQARDSFRNSQVAIAVGLMTIVLGASIALLVRDPTSKLTTTALTAVAGALSGYIGRTFLRVYDRAQHQLTFFFQQPLVNSYLLAAERLIANMGTNRDRELSRVIQQMMELLAPLEASGSFAGGSSRRAPRGAGIPGRGRRQPLPPAANPARVENAAGSAP